MLAGSTRARVEDLNWSDGEDCDEKYVVKHWDMSNRNDDDESLDSFQINEKSDKEQTSLIGIDRLADHRRSKYSGYVKVDKKLRANPLPSKNISILSPEKFYYPTVPSDVKHILGDVILLRLWKECVKYGADESEMILVTDARTMGSILQTEEGLPFDKLKILKAMESEDYIEYSVLCTELAKHYKPTERLTTSKPSTALCHVCCAIGACRHRSTLPGVSRSNTSSPSPFPTIPDREEGKDDESSVGQGDQDQNDGGSVFSEMKYVNSEDHRLSTIFSHIKHSLEGKIRNKHISEVMDRLFIPYDKKRLPKSYWTNYGEMYIKSIHELKQLINLIRTDLDEVIDPLAAMFKYELPQWLREEFKASEIMLYEHHFALIDVDNGGSIDVDELQALITNFGSKISREDAQALLDEYDMDGGGTIDFVEFMVLIYKIQRGTIDLSSSDLAKALVEAKSQLKIFEEIEEVSRDPPQYCTVAHFGGTPVACNFHIQGPLGTPYEGVVITLQMVFHDGYPFRQPDIQFQGRVLSLHVLPQLSGDARLMHVKEVWTAEWSMRKLLVHTVDVLTHPEPELLPDAFYTIYKSWEAAWERKCAELKTKLKYEIGQQALAAEAEEAEAAGEGEGASQTQVSAVAEEKAQSAPGTARGGMLRAESKLGTPQQQMSRQASGTSTPVAAQGYSRPPSGAAAGPSTDAKYVGGSGTPPQHNQQQMYGTDSKAGSCRPSNLTAGAVGAGGADSKVGSARGTPADTKMSDNKSDNKGEAGNKDLPSGAEPAPAEVKNVFIPTPSQVENAEVSDELWEERKSELARTVTMDYLSDGATRQSIVKLSRIERMHLGTLLVYLTDKRAYFEKVESFMRTHAKCLPQEGEELC